MNSERRREYATKIMEATQKPHHAVGRDYDEGIMCAHCDRLRDLIVPILEEMIREQARGYFQGCLHGKPLDETCDDCDTELTT